MSFYSSNRKQIQLVMGMGGRIILRTSGLETGKMAMPPTRATRTG